MEGNVGSQDYDDMEGDLNQEEHELKIQEDKKRRRTGMTQKENVDVLTRKVLGL